MDTNTDRGVACNAVAVYILTLCACHQCRSLCFTGVNRVPINLLHHAFCVCDHTSPGSRNGSRHIFLKERRHTGSHLSIQTVGSDLVTQLSLVQHISNERIFFTFGFHTRIFPRFQQMTNNRGDNALLAIGKLRPPTHLAPAFHLLFASEFASGRISLDRFKVVEFRVDIVVPRQIVVQFGSSQQCLPVFRSDFDVVDPNQIVLQIVRLGPHLAIRRQIPPFGNRRVQRRIIIARHRILAIHRTLGRQHDRALVPVVVRGVFQVGHQRVFLPARFRDITGQLDALATKHQKRDRDTANTRHLDVSRQHIDLGHQMMDQVAILNTVFRDHGTRGGGLFRHPENVLWGYVVFRHAPFQGLGFRIQVVVVSLHADHVVGPAAFLDTPLDREDFELLTFQVVICSECGDLDVDEILLVHPRQVFAVQPRDVAVRWTSGQFDLFDVVPDERTRHIVQFVRRQVVIPAKVEQQIDLQSPRHFGVAQVVVTAGESVFRLFQALFARHEFLVAFLVQNTRQTGELVDAVQFP